MKIIGEHLVNKLLPNKCLNNSFYFTKLRSENEHSEKSAYREKTLQP